jgi:hypothetical protein
MLPFFSPGILYLSIILEIRDIKEDSHYTDVLRPVTTKSIEINSAVLVG